MKRKFLGKLSTDFIILVVFWTIIHILGWYAQGFTGFLTGQLIYKTLGITLLLSLLLSNSGKHKGDLAFGIPLINSYLKKIEAYLFLLGDLI
jgi:hypothetical protein